MRRQNKAKVHFFASPDLDELPYVRFQARRPPVIHVARPSSPSHLSFCGFRFV